MTSLVKAQQKLCIYRFFYTLLQVKDDKDPGEGRVDVIISERCHQLQLRHN